MNSSKASADIKMSAFSLLFSVPKDVQLKLLLVFPQSRKTARRFLVKL